MTIEVPIAGSDEKVTKTVYQITVDGVTKEVSEADYNYQVDSEDTYGFGVSTKDSSGYKLSTAREIGTAMATPGGLSAWMEGQEETTIGGKMSVFDSLPKLAQMAKIVEDDSENQLSIFDINVPSKAGAVIAILEEAGYTAYEAEQAIKAYNDELLYEGIRANGTYGDSTEDVIANMEQLAGSAEDAAQAFHDLFDAMYQIEDLDTLIALWNAGSRSDFVVSGVAAAIGMEENDVRDAANKDIVDARLAAERSVLSGNYQEEVSAYDRYLTPEIMTALGINNGGSIKLSESIPILKDMVANGNQDAAMLLNGLAAMQQVSGGDFNLSGGVTTTYSGGFLSKEWTSILSDPL